MAGFIPFLSQGDHGLNLYAAQAVSNGGVPYRDFAWFYGPVMPYYYAFFLKCFGPGIQSVLMAKALLIFLSGIFIYLNLTLFFPRFFSAVGAVWFWVFLRDFPYTFNHIGGLPILLLICLLTLKSIKLTDHKFLYWCLPLFLLLSLIKLNIGFAAIFAVVLIAFLNGFYNKRQPLTFYALAILAIPALTIVIYWLFVKNLPFYYVSQCLPYFGTYFQLGLADVHQKNMVTNILVSAILLKESILSSWASVVFALLLNIAALACLNLRQRLILQVLSALLILYVCCLHEFLIMGTFYQAYWAEPFKVLLMFSVIGFAAVNIPKFKIWIAALVIVLIGVFLLPSESTLLAQYQSPKTSFNIDKTKITIANDPQWVQTVSMTTRYLNENLGKNELFWAVPYDALYYFLTDKPSPTKEVMLLNIGISPEQERQIIKDLEDKKVGWIVLSNRGMEKGITTISKTYCPAIHQYIEDTFVVEKQFGEWTAEPYWWANHGTKILRRKEK